VWIHTLRYHVFHGFLDGNIAVELETSKSGEKGTIEDSRAHGKFLDVRYNRVLNALDLFLVVLAHEEPLESRLLCERFAVG
jgi:hypothetical protein